MPIAKRGSRARVSPWVRCKAGALVNASSIRSEVTGTMMRAVIAKLSGCRRRAAISTPRGALFSRVSSTPGSHRLQGLIDQPDLPAAQQVLQDQARSFVPPLDTPEGETGMAHRLEHDRFVGVRSEPCCPGVAVERV